MTIGVMITNGGPHPADKWADQSAKQLVNIITIEPSSQVYQAATEAKINLENELRTALEKDHKSLQDIFRANKKIEAASHAEDALQTVLKITDKSMFRDHFRKPDTQDFVKRALTQHFDTSLNIEKDWKNKESK